jgi:hypothetical protein
MKKFIIPLLLLISGSLFSQVAVGASPGNNNRWTFGGGYWSGFWKQQCIYFPASPRVGYRLTDDLEVELLGVFLGRPLILPFYYVWSRPVCQLLYCEIFLFRANFQHYFINYKDKYYDYKMNKEETALYLGGGYMQRIGTNSYMQIGIMYNVLWKENESIFSSGLVPNIGFVVGL